MTNVVNVCPQERVFNWVVREHGTQAGVPTAALLEFLRQEMQVWGCIFVCQGGRVSPCGAQHADGGASLPNNEVPFPACVPPPQYVSGTLIHFVLCTQCAATTVIQQVCSLVQPSARKLCFNSTIWHMVRLQTWTSAVRACDLSSKSIVVYQQ